MRYSLLIPLLSFGLFGQTDKPFSATAGVKIGSPVNDPADAGKRLDTFFELVLVKREPDRAAMLDLVRFSVEIAKTAESRH